MESVIKYFYGLNIDDITFKKDYYYITANNDKYILKELIESIEELEKIINKLNLTKIKYHLLVLTKDGKPYFIYDNKTYVLLKVRCNLENKVSILDFCNYEENGISLWGDIWSKRVDYYETQVEELIKNKEIKYALEYYIGLTEIAIYYYNNLKTIYNNEELKYTLSHKQISFPYSPIDYYDPTNIIIDLEVRDLAEYFKAAFFNEALTEYELLNLIDNLKFSDAMANYLFLRLLYPTYFFNLYDDCIESKELNDKLFLYIKKSKEYESLLSKVYSRLSLSNKLLIKLWFIKFQHL